MNAEIENRLNKKLMDVVIHLAKIQEEKKASNASFNEEINGAKMRMNCLAEVLESKDLTKLDGVFFDTEIIELTRVN